jgi:hypothetical protein
MVDEVLFSEDSDLTTRTLGEAFGRSPISNYVERGLSLTVDFDANVADIDAGKLYALRNGRDLTILSDAVAGVTLPTDGVAHVFGHVTESSNADGSTTLGFEYVVNTDGTQPSGTALKIAQIDMAAEEVTLINRDAPGGAGGGGNVSSYKGNDIDSDGDGVVNEAETAQNVSSIDGGNVNGAVAEADHATTADTADSVDGILGSEVTSPVDEADSATVAEGLTTQAQGALTQIAPNGGFAKTEIGGYGEASFGFDLSNGETFRLWYGNVVLHDDTDAPSVTGSTNGVNLQLQTGGGTELARVEDVERNNPIASYSGATAEVWLRNALPDPIIASAQFGYTIER